MPNKNYKKGYRFQQRVKRYLEKKGWFIMLAPKSKFPDGIAAGRFDWYLFECKWNKYLTKGEKEKAAKLKKDYGCLFKVFWNNKGKINSYWL